MRTVILVPRRAGIRERDEIWEWCRRRWEQVHPDLAIYEGHHDDGPFNRSAAINLAARLADEDGPWDLAVIIDADIFIEPAQVIAAIARAAETGRVTWAFQEWVGLTRDAAKRLIAGDPSQPGDIRRADVEKRNPISWSCCFVVPRAVFDDIGGFDERFSGWGWEDLAFQAAVVGLHGHERLAGDLYHLWHPRHPGLGEDGINKRRNRQLGRRYMYALRVKGHHDRVDEADEARMEKDRQNLLTLMEREELDRHGRPAADLPDWIGWLPTLEELVASWKERRAPGPSPLVSVVVRTGGKAAVWPERRAYLERMLESLTAHVRIRGETLVDSKAIVRMVVYSDWPASVTPELEAIAAPHGFYRVGEGNVGFTPSMAKLWRYLGSRKDRFDYVLLVEDDFLFERDVDLGDLMDVLAGRPHLVQMALLREACYPAERERGGILGHPESEFDHVSEDGRDWLEHRRFFTLNPTLFRRSLTNETWPPAPHAVCAPGCKHNSEAVFGRRLFRTDGRRRAAFWGDGEAWVTHLGEVRAGSGY